MGSDLSGPKTSSNGQYAISAGVEVGTCLPTHVGSESDQVLSAKHILIDGPSILNPERQLYEMREPNVVAERLNSPLSGTGGIPQSTISINTESEVTSIL